MFVQSTPTSFELESGRKGHVVAVGAAFNLSFDEEPVVRAEVAALPEVGGEETDHVAEALLQNGFRGVSPVVFDDIRPTEAAASLMHEAVADQAGFALFSTSMAPDEDLVLLEFNPGTGDVLDWFLPVPDDTKNKMHQMATALPLDSDQPGYQPVMFKIPLYARYTSSPEAYGLAPAALPGAFTRKVFKLFSLDKIERFVSEKIGEWLAGPVRLIDRKLVKKEVLGLFGRSGGPAAMPAETVQRLQGQRGLLFVHGIISSSSRAFGALQQDEAWYNAVSQAYNGNLLAYDHWTLSKDIFENAQRLADSLPEGMTLDIICHSRGAGVVRSLLELEDVRGLLSDKGINVRKVIFVAGACEGSDLATENALDNVFRILNKMGVLTGMKPFPTAALLQAVKLIIGGLQNLPGTDSMDPNGNFIGTLRESTCTRAAEYGYVRANYDPPSWSVAAADDFILDSTVFAEKGNDCIVPFAGAGVSDTYLHDKVVKTSIHDFGSANDPDSEVWHITFFQHPRTKAELKAQLLI